MVRNTGYQSRIPVKVSEEDRPLLLLAYTEPEVAVIGWTLVQKSYTSLHGGGGGKGWSSTLTSAETRAPKNAKHEVYRLIRWQRSEIHKGSRRPTL